MAHPTTKEFVMSRLVLIAALVTAIAVPVISNTPVTSEKHPTGKSEQRQEFWNWFQNNVYPTLKKWHDEYDASLSSADLASLNTLRNQARQNKLALKAKAIELRENTTTKTDKKEAIQHLKSQAKDAKSDIAKQLRPIMQRSKEKLASIVKANQSTIEAWQKEAQAKFTQIPKGAPMIQQDGKKAAVRFVLWDGTMPTPLSSKGKTSH